MTDFGAYAESLYQQVLPLHGPDPQGLAHDFVAAVAQPMREIDELVRDTPEGTGWSVILDVDAAPVKGLYWLSQLAGVKLRQRKALTFENLIPDPSFENPGSGGLTDVFGVSSTLTTLAGGSHGARRLKGTASSNGTRGVLYNISGTENTRYTAGVDVLHLDRAGEIQIVWLDGTVTPISTISGDLSTDLNRRTVTGVAPPTTEFVSVRFMVPSSLTGETFELDAFSLMPGAGTDYFDGESVGAIWEGTRYESTSRLARMESDAEWSAYARDAIKRQGGKRRGTTDSILSAAEDTLSPGAVARLTPRVGGNANALTLTTRPSETPDAAATLAAANTMKPFGKKITHVLTEDLLIDEESGTIDTATGTIDVPT